MRPSRVLQLMQSLHASLEELETIADKVKIKSKYFISAEGAYSSLVFGRTDLKVLIAGRMFDDKKTKPIIFKVVQIKIFVSHVCQEW